MGKEKTLFGKRKQNYNHVIFGEHPIVKKAPEPSNIIWENYSVSRKYILIRRICAYILIMIIYMSIYFFIFKYII